MFCWELILEQVRRVSVIGTLLSSGSLTGIEIYGDQRGKEGKVGKLGIWINRYTLLYIK